MAWVQAENTRSLAVLEGDPRYPALRAEALVIAQAKDRIPMPEFLGGGVYNFWQDADHVRGVWRRTSVADYANPTPDWSTVLDIDQLAKAERANWVFKGADCAEPRERRCLIALSDGGEDAVTLREFDLESDRFVDGGFILPHSKQTAAWLDENTVLVARDWGQGSMTASGYPFVARVWVRRKSSFTASPATWR
jgi:prolyl oligopeptidase